MDQITAELDFDESLLQEIANAELGATVSLQNRHSNAGNGYERFLVLEVSDAGFQGKTLRLFDESNQQEKWAILQGQWISSQVNSGDHVHIIGSFDSLTRTCVIDDLNHLIVIHPDILISGTTVATSYPCIRKAVLSEILSSNEPSYPALIGSMCHEMFERALARFDFDTVKVELDMEDIINRNIIQLYALRKDETETRIALRSLVPEMQRWANSTLATRPVQVSIFTPPVTETQSNGRFNVHNGRPMSRHNSSNSSSLSRQNSIAESDIKILAEGVVGIEQNIWSPMFGLKGKLDATLMVSIIPPAAVNKENIAGPFSSTGAATATSTGTDVSRCLVPLELKTGNKEHMTHRGQVLLYTLLLQDRYKMKVDNGLLLYIKNSRMNRVTSSRGELASLIQRRNEIASSLHHMTVGFNGSSVHMRLPPMLRQRSECERCYMLDSCSIYHASVEHGNGQTSGLDKIFDDKVGHLSRRHKQYFRHWEHLISLEGSDVNRYRKEIWNMDPIVREGLGRCISRLILISVESIAAGSQYIFQRQRSTDATVDLMSLPFSVGDYVVLSTHQGQYCLVSGMIRQMTCSTVTVECQDSSLADDLKPLGPLESLERFADSETSAAIRARRLNQILSESSRPRTTHVANADPTLESILWRIDKDELSSSFGLIRNNLMKLFQKDSAVESGGDGNSRFRGQVNSSDETPSIDMQRKRELIVDLAPPRFNKNATHLLDDGSNPSVAVGEQPATVSAVSTGTAAVQSREDILREFMDIDFDAFADDLIMDEPFQQRINEPPPRVELQITNCRVGGEQPTVTRQPLNQPINHRINQPIKLPPALAEEFNRLNVDQKRAMNKVLECEDYALILGMPGTGKTTTVAFVIRTLVALGYSVLLTSYTHSAVDNIMLKLLPTQEQHGGSDMAEKCLRLGRSNQVHESVRVCCVPTDLTSTEQLQRFIRGKQVVATTCLGVKDPLLNRMRFDYCIVDEASQITQPVCLGPLRFAQRFVLVGDHYQLPPLVRNLEAKEAGLDVSLFRCLCEAHPEAIVSLENQYRMNADIMLLSNTLVYSQKLRCGTAAVATSSLSLPRYDATHDLSSTWIRDVLQPSRTVAFLATDNVPAPESSNGQGIMNRVEVQIVVQVIQSLIQGGIEEAQIGVISPYREQLKLFKTALTDLSGVELLTVDKSQGRDKDCILISLVKCNDRQSVGDLLKDWRRLNVAFTRAKKKLIIVGSESTLSSSPLFNSFLDLVRTKNWIYPLPRNAHQLSSSHAVTVSSTVESVNTSCSDLSKDMITELSLLSERDLNFEFISPDRYPPNTGANGSSSSLASSSVSSSVPSRIDSNKPTTIRQSSGRHIGIPPNRTILKNVMSDIGDLSNL